MSEDKGQIGGISDKKEDEEQEKGYQESKTKHVTETTFTLEEKRAGTARSILN